MTFPLLFSTLLNGLAYGLLLFMLSAGLTLVFSLLGVLNFAHASFYMLGAYLGYAFTGAIGFWPALLAAPLAVGLLGAVFERLCLRRLHARGPVPGLLATFGLSWLVVEGTQLFWGRSSLPYALPEMLRGAAFTVYGVPFAASRVLVMAVALGMLVLAWMLLARSQVGLLVRAALVHPQMAQALGHNVPLVFTAVFAAGAALAGLAGAVGGAVYVTEPGMAAAVGSIVFVVVVVGGMGSLAGAFAASLLIGMLQNLAVAFDVSVQGVLQAAGLSADWLDGPLGRIGLAQAAPLLPYLLMVAVLVLRPRGLMGNRN
ncbi:branched-chain amino acid ABC transporter permease [Xylophilus rhododendri]|uniref:Branched-chain amino acid ABC transporter permease n=1 Tax=Xylophilus rhododendri TaxID=2697032 RepID=A0A857J0C1_9BURK|nr:branched-chain amino acid ABC transporter permease [Xylophilus rhododendri]QHI96542.1 branched-chain amino acid ABC transporter permease [Xylophilus rhododendri]